MKKIIQKITLLLLIGFLFFQSKISPDSRTVPVTNRYCLELCEEDSRLHTGY
mgnify:CR=1 FL=1